MRSGFLMDDEVGCRLGEVNDKLCTVDMYKRVGGRVKMRGDFEFLSTRMHRRSACRLLPHEHHLGATLAE